MQSQSQLKFFTFTRFTIAKLIYFVSGNVSEKDEIKQEAVKVTESLIKMRLYTEERQKISSNHGNWYATVDGQEMLYLVLCSSDYPERHAYEMIKKLREQFEKLGNYGQEDDPSLKFNAKETMTELFKKYNDIRNLTALDKANNSVKEVQDVMSTNIKKTLDNQQNLQKLDQKTSSMATNAKQFEKQAHSLERIMYMRNLKLKIIIILVVIAILAYIVVPICISLFGKDENKNNNQGSNTNANSTPTSRFLNFE